MLRAILFFFLGSSGRFYVDVFRGEDPYSLLDCHLPHFNRWLDLLVVIVMLLRELYLLGGFRRHFLEIH